jgi:hypothetical protein
MTVITNIFNHFNSVTMRKITAAFVLLLLMLTGTLLHAQRPGLDCQTTNFNIGLLRYCKTGPYVCNGGSGQVLIRPEDIVGGVRPYTLFFYGRDNVLSRVVGSKQETPIVYTASDLPAGNYRLVIRDMSDQCSPEISITINDLDTLKNGAYEQEFCRNGAGQFVRCPFLTTYVKEAHPSHVTPVSCLGARDGRVYYAPDWSKNIQRIRNQFDVGTAAYQQAIDDLYYSVYPLIVSISNRENTVSRIDTIYPFEADYFASYRTRTDLLVNDIHPDGSRLWPNGIVIEQTPDFSDFRGLPAGEYSVTVRTNAINRGICDRNTPTLATCLGTFVYEVETPKPLSLTLNASDITCTTQGGLTIDVRGGLFTGKRVEIYETEPFSARPESGQITDINGRLIAPVDVIDVTTEVIPRFNGNVWVGSDTITRASSFADSRIITGGTDRLAMLNRPGTYWVRVAEIAQDHVAPGKPYIGAVYGNCSVKQSFVIRQNTPVSVSFTTRNTTCNRQNIPASDAARTTTRDGEIRLNIDRTRGTAPYSIDWSDISNTEDNRPGDERFITRLGLRQGIYTVTVSDARGCRSIQEIAINEKEPIMVDMDITDASCDGSSRGRVMINEVTGGNGGGRLDGYSYRWSNGQVSMGGRMVSGLIAGSYTLTVTDVAASGCDTIIRFDINQEQASTIEIEQIVTRDAICFGQPSGFARIEFTSTALQEYPIVLRNDASFLYTDTLRIGSRSVSFNNLPEGNFEVTIIDPSVKNALCYTKANFRIGQPERLEVITSPDSVACRGERTGAVRIEVNGGALNRRRLPLGNFLVEIYDSLNFRRTPIETRTITDTILSIRAIENLLPAGKYEVRVFQVRTDLPGAPRCTSDFVSFRVGQPRSGVVARINILDSVYCNPANAPGSGSRQGYEGRLEADTRHFEFDGDNSGTPPYQYFWTARSGEFPRDRTHRQAIFPNVPPGIYTLTVVDSRGCTASSTVLLPEPNLLQIDDIRSQGIAPLSCTETATFTGRIDVFMNGAGSGMCPYFGNEPATNGGRTPCIEWFPRVPNSRVVRPNAGDPRFAIIEGLQAGRYTVTVRDVRGCFDTKSIIVPPPAGAIRGMVIDTVQPCFRTNNGSLRISPVGGNGRYSIEVKRSNNDILGPRHIVDTIFGSIQSFRVRELFPDVYTVTLTDANNCKFSQAIDLTNIFPLQVAYTRTNATCYNGKDGALNLRLTGGRAPYRISWDNQYPLDSFVTINSNFNNTAIRINDPAFRSPRPRPYVVYATANYNRPRYGGTPNESEIINTEITLRDTVAGIYNFAFKDALGCEVYAKDTIKQPLRYNIRSINAPFPTRAVRCGEGNSGYISTIYIKPGYSFGDARDNTNGVDDQAITTVALNPGQTTFENISVRRNGGLLTLGVEYNIDTTAAPDIQPSNLRPTLLAARSSMHNFTTYRFTGLTPGSYTISFRNGRGCTMDTTFTINPVQPLASRGFNVRPTTECGNPKGRLTLNISGGQAPYIYSLRVPGTTRETARMTTSQDSAGFALREGSYDIAVIDAAGCELSGLPTQTIVAPTPPTIMVTKIRDVLCNNPNVQVNSGIAYATPGGGQTIIGNPSAPTYNVYWYQIRRIVRDNIEIVDTTLVYSGDTVTNLDGGDYWVCAMQRETNCRTCTLFNIAKPTPIEFRVAQTPLTCFDSNDGVLEVAPLRGSGNFLGGTTYPAGNEPYEYQWAFTGQVISPYGTPGNRRLTALQAGRYSVCVRDRNGCITCQEAVLVNPKAIFTNVVVLDTVTCEGGDNGRFQIVVTGGTENYKISLFKDEGNGNFMRVRGPIFAEDDPREEYVFGGLTEGNYRFQVIDYDEVPSPLNRLDTIDRCTLDTRVNFMPTVSELSATVSGNNIDCSGQPATVTANFVSRVSGRLQTARDLTFDWLGGEPVAGNPAQRNYRVAGNYSVNISDRLGCIEVVSFAVTNEPFRTELQVRNVTCKGRNDGQIVLNTRGRNTPYRYVVTSNGATVIDITSASTNLSLGPLAPGNYVVNATDGRGCTIPAMMATVTEAAAPLRARLIGTEPVRCLDSRDGRATIDVVGGVSPYNFAWSSGSTSPFPNDLPAGNGFVTVRDANGCDTTIFFLIARPATQLTVDRVVTDQTNCRTPNGAIDLRVTGGDAPYSFSWSRKEAPNVVIATSEDLKHLVEGVYVGAVTDANGCTKVAEVTVGGPRSVEVVTRISDLRCFNGNDASIAVTDVRGGTTPLTFVWSNGVSGARTISGLTRGNYTVSITDANACVFERSYNIGLSLRDLVQDWPPVVTPVSSCGASDGSVAVAAPGDNSQAPFAYRWAKVGEPSFISTSQNLTNVPTGDYRLTIIYGNEGCSKMYDAVFVGQPNAIFVNPAVTPISCNGRRDASISLNVSGATGPYTYTWRGVTANGNMAENLGAGIYTVTITDVSGCTIVREFNIVEPAPLAITSATVNNVTCNGAMNGSIMITVGGGTAPYRFNWSNSAITQNLINLSGGEYVGTITDSRGCVLISPVVEVTEPNALVDSISTRPAGCVANNDGTAKVFVTGGTLPYAYNWGNGGDTDSISGLAAGSYVVTITDGNNCTKVDTAVVAFSPGTTNFQISVLNGQALDSVLTLCQGREVQLTVTPSVPTNGSILWSTGEPSATITYLADTIGVQTITATVVNECKQPILASVRINTIAVPTKPSVSVQTAGTDTVRLIATNAGRPIQWFRISNDTSEIIEGQNGDTLLVAQDSAATQQFVVVVGSDDCNAVSDTVTVFRVSRNPLAAPASLPISLYPNPTNGSVSLTANFPTQVSVAVRVFNQVGQMVYAKPAVATNNGNIEVSLEHLANGVYNVQVVAGTQVWNGRVVKQ